MSRDAASSIRRINPPELGTPPGYGPVGVSTPPNAAAITRRIWMPGLDEGYNAQGLAVAGTSILFFHEVISFRRAAGVIVIVLGMFLMNRQSSRVNKR